ncbi:MAG: hypothetical protein HW421_3150 [Ignavibacteria bacterium]|nr:hypothetical protein [Ignavibacteria bacterium]
MSVKQKYDQLKSIPSGIAIKKLFSKITDYWAIPRKRRIALRRSAYPKIDLSNIIINSILNFSNNEIPTKFITDYMNFANKIVAHQFDLLGSGEVTPHYGMNPRGLHDIIYDSTIENSRNKILLLLKSVNEYNNRYADKVLELISNDYELIDWLLDFKSGYRWDGHFWSKDIRYGKVLGADIKVPWELGRMQHLPVLAIAATSVQSDLIIDSNLKSLFAKEFRNEVLDFIAFNPPGFGCQWMSSMDVAIRISNWLVAYDIFCSAGINFDTEFITIFKDSIYAHGLHIYNNLEWSGGLRGNHYFADLSGLIFIGAYFSECPDAVRWLGFAVNSLAKEILYQYNEDGSNFEASAHYHCFSTEMLVYSIAALNSIDDNIIKGIIPQSLSFLRMQESPPAAVQGIPASTGMTSKGTNKNILDRIGRIYEFTNDLIRQDGSIPRFGDDDAGRFFKLSPLEKDNNYLYLKEILDALTDNYQNPELFYSPEYFLIEQLSGVNKNNFPDIINQRPTSTKAKTKSYPDFGIYFYDFQNYNIAIRCGSLGQKGKGGHAHNDQLSFELYVRNKPFIIDAGTYLYTPFPEIRNRFRKTSKHNVLSIEGIEQNPLQDSSDDDLFWLSDRAKGRVLSMDENTFSAGHRGYGEECFRHFNFSNEFIKVKDSCAVQGKKTVRFHLHPQVEINQIEKDKIGLTNDGVNIMLFSGNAEFVIEEFDFSPSYGKLEKSNVLILGTPNVHITWKIQL